MRIARLASSRLTRLGTDGRIGSHSTREHRMTHSELAWEFADLFGELAPEQINQVLAKNVPIETLQFFSDYARTVAERDAVGDAMQQRIPNLLLLGYLLRVLEERLIDGEDVGHA
jgi:hypothetical protein